MQFNSGAKSGLRSPTHLRASRKFLQGILLIIAAVIVIASSYFVPAPPPPPTVIPSAKLITLISAGRVIASADHPLELVTDTRTGLQDITGYYKGTTPPAQEIHFQTQPTPSVDAGILKAIHDAALTLTPHTITSDPVETSAVHWMKISIFAIVILLSISRLARTIAHFRRARS